MIEIKENPYKTQCDICTSRDTLSIVGSGTTPYHYPVICRNDLKEIVEKGMKFFKIEAEPPGDLIKQLEAKDTVIEQLQQNIAELNCKITELEGNNQKNSVDIEAMSRGELLSLAKKMNIEGKFVTLKTPDLVAKIKEAQKG